MFSIIVALSMGHVTYCMAYYGQKGVSESKWAGSLIEIALEIISFSLILYFFQIPILFSQ